MMMEKTAALSPAVAKKPGSGTGLRLRLRKPGKQAPHRGKLGRLKKECRQLQMQMSALETTLKRQSADTCGLQALYDQLVNEIKHHRDILQLDSFDAEKSSAVYTQAWRSFMAGQAIDYQTHRHTNSRSRLPLF